MDRSAYTEEVQKRHEALLLDVGNKLANPPSSTDELLPLLSRAEFLLHRVFQTPHESIKAAIRPAMDALISDKILKHTDLNIQVAVASCFNEIIRIASPDYPYTDDQMKEIFGLFMVAFKQLSCESNKTYDRALEILEVVSTIRSCVIMQDIEIDSMVVEMFEIFLNTIKTNHSADVFMHMKSIMTTMVEECECPEFTEDLVRPLLSSVKLDNKNTSLRAWELGKSVVENCATKLQRHVREVVKAMNLNVADYAEIVASLCKDTPTGNDTVAIEEFELVASIQVANEEAGEVESVRVGDEEVATPQFEATDASGDGVSKLDERSQAMPEMQMRVERSRRGLRPNTFTSADEGYQHTWLTGGLGSSRGYYYLLSPSEHKNAQDSSQKKNDYVKKLNIGKRGQSKKKEGMTSEDKAEEVSPKPTKEILRHNTVGSDKKKKTTKGLHVGSGTVGIENEQVSCSASDSDGKDKNKITSSEPESGDVVDKVMKLLTSGPAKSKHSRGKEKCSNTRKKTAKRFFAGSVQIGAKNERLNHSASGSELEDKSGSTSQQLESAYVENVVNDPISEPKKAKKCKVEEKGPIKGKKSTECGVVRSRTDAWGKANVSHSAADPQAKDENEHDSQKLDSEDVDKVVESPISQSAKSKQSEVKGKGSKKGKKRSRSDVGFGVEKGNVSPVADSVPNNENAITPVVLESADVEKVVESPTSKPTKAKKSKLKEKEKKISKSIVVQSDTLGAEKEEISHGATDRERKHGNKITSQNLEKYEPEDVVDKVVESLTTANAKFPGSSDAEKEMEPTNVRLEYGQELVNLRIMVWWPIDKTYYTGTVVAFDHVTKKHKKILYDDDEEETLDMSEEIWELFNDIRPEELGNICIQNTLRISLCRIASSCFCERVEAVASVQIIYDGDEEETPDMSKEIWELFNGIQSSDRPEEPCNSQKKKTKGKSSSSKKEHAGPSSERLQYC